MSGLILPSGIITPHPYNTKVVNPENNVPVVDEEFDATPVEDRPKRLPNPQGYQILCTVAHVEKEYDSGIVKADITVEHDEIMSLVLFVVKVGPAAYADKERFPNGPYCKEGDFILTKALSGTRFKVHGQEFRLINDDSVLATVDDPRAITRV